MRTTSWSFVGQCGLPKTNAPINSIEKSPSNFIQIKSHLATTCEHKRRPFVNLRQKNRDQKDQKDLPQKKKQKNLTCNKTSGVFSPFLLDVKNDSGCVRRLPTSSPMRMARPQRVKITLVGDPTASCSPRILGVPNCWGWESFPLLKPCIHIYIYIYSLFIGEDIPLFQVPEMFGEVCPWKYANPKGKWIIFQPSIFQVRTRCSLQGG